MYKTKKQVLAEICRDIHRQMAKEKCRKQERREKTVKLSKYIEKEDGTLVPKPKLISRLKGIQPRPGGFCVKGQRPQKQIVEPTTCRENVNLELKYLDPINKDSDISLYENMSDFEIINRENNIVEHFERLLLLMEILAKNPTKIKERKAYSVIEFLESVQTQDGQLGPNAQGLVNYINHLLDQQCDVDNSDGIKVDAKEDTNSSIDSEHENKHDRAKLCRQINDKLKSVKDTYEKQNANCGNLSKQQFGNMGQKQIVESFTASFRLQNMQVNNPTIVNHVIDKAKTDHTILDSEVTNSSCKPTMGQLNSTEKALGKLPEGIVHQKKLPMTEEANLLCIGDSFLVGDEIVQACHEPTSRSISTTSCLDETMAPNNGAP